MRPIKEVVNRRDWQTLRKSFLGTWKTHPIQNTNKLREFLGNMLTAEDDKLRIVHNYLTGSGFRLGIIHHSEIEKLLEEVRMERFRRKIIALPLDFSPNVTYT